MKVLNVHSRIIDQSKDKIVDLFKTLASMEDLIWPKENWPRMKFEKGLVVGSKGGHGPIRYTVDLNSNDGNIKFKFSKPKGFEGVHGFEITELDSYKTQVRHVIDMNLSGWAKISWPMAIQYLHDALMEDALDKLENHFDGGTRKTNWSFWVRFLRSVLK